LFSARACCRAEAFELEPWADLLAGEKLLAPRAFTPMVWKRDPSAWAALVPAAGDPAVREAAAGR
jgi:hypothetical protein